MASNQYFELLLWIRVAFLRCGEVGAWRYVPACVSLKEVAREDMKRCQSRIQEIMRMNVVLSVFSLFGIYNNVGKDF